MRQFLRQTRFQRRNVRLRQRKRVVQVKVSLTCWLYLLNLWRSVNSPAADLHHLSTETQHVLFLCEVVPEGGTKARIMWCMNWKCVCVCLCYQQAWQQLVCSSSMFSVFSDAVSLAGRLAETHTNRQILINDQCKSTILFLKNMGFINFYTMNIFYLLCKQKYKVWNIHILFIQYISHITCETHIFPSPFDESWRVFLFPDLLSESLLRWIQLNELGEWVWSETGSDKYEDRKRPRNFTGTAGWRLHLDRKMHRAVSVITRSYIVYILCV